MVEYWVVYGSDSESSDYEEYLSETTTIAISPLTTALVPTAATPLHGQ